MYEKTFIVEAFLNFMLPGYKFPKDLDSGYFPIKHFATTHVLLEASRRSEQAFKIYDEQLGVQRGRFTKALLDVLQRTPASQVNPAEIIDQLNSELFDG